MVENNNAECQVIIIGAGILARLVSWRFEQLQIPHEVLIPNSNVNYQFNYLEGVRSRSVPYGEFGHSEIWGNQHDIDPKPFWEPPSFSDLPGFPFPYEAIRDHLGILNQFLKIDLQRKEAIGNPFYSSFSGYKFHLKGRKTSVERNFPISTAGKYRFHPGSLKFTRLENQRIGLRFNDENDKSVRLFTRQIVLATGGLGNLTLAKKIYRDFKILQPAGLGIGYANHPKSLIFQIALKKYFRMKIKEQRKDRNWRRFLVIDRSIDCNGGRGPRISVRFWSLSAREFESNNLGKINFLNLVVDKLLRQFGYSKFLSAVAYFEMPQLSKSKLIVNERIENIEIQHTQEQTPDLEEYFKNCLKLLKNEFKDNQFVDGLFEKDLNLSDFHFQDSHHYMGTTRMALDGNSGAVDCWGELFGIPGIYCVGTSVLPVSAVNHPTYLALALGLKTIDRVNISLKK